MAAVVAPRRLEWRSRLAANVRRARGERLCLPRGRRLLGGRVGGGAVGLRAAGHDERLACVDAAEEQENERASMFSWSPSPVVVKGLRFELTVAAVAAAVSKLRSTHLSGSGRASQPGATTREVRNRGTVVAAAWYLPRLQWILSQRVFFAWWSSQLGAVSWLISFARLTVSVPCPSVLPLSNPTSSSSNLTPAGRRQRSLQP